MQIREVKLHILKAAVLVSLALILLCPNISRAQNQEPVDIPLIRLIVVPEKYHGVLVRTIGFVRLEFEGDVMYPHKEDCTHALLGNGIWIDIGEKHLRQASTLGMKYCLIEATFDANERGHFGMWSGSFKNIRRFEVWSDPAKPRYSGKKQ